MSQNQKYSLYLRIDEISPDLTDGCFINTELKMHYEYVNGYQMISFGVKLFHKLLY